MQLIGKHGQASDRPGEKKADFRAGARRAWKRRGPENKFQPSSPLYPGERSQCGHQTGLLLRSGQHGPGPPGRPLDPDAAALLWEGPESKRSDAAGFSHVRTADRVEEGELCAAPCCRVAFSIPPSSWRKYPNACFVYSFYFILETDDPNFASGPLCLISPLSGLLHNLPVHPSVDLHLSTVRHWECRSAPGSGWWGGVFPGHICVKI